jgi:hypothetical protein
LSKDLRLHDAVESESLAAQVDAVIEIFMTPNPLNADGSLLRAVLRTVVVGLGS